MTLWKETQLTDLIKIKHGFAFKSTYFSDHGKYIVLTPGNFHEEGGFRVRPGKDRAYSGKIPEGYILQEGDLIVAMTEQGEGLLGSTAIIPESGKYLHNQRLGLIEVNQELVDKKFIYYLFNTNLIRQQIRGSSSGTKVRHTSPERIYGVKASLPSVDIQKKIAAVLSAYDDLIENNKRRIALLEKMAEEIYREWFVRMRFPGHEKAKFRKGVPEGWEIVRLGDIVELGYGKALKQESRKAGDYPVYGSSGVVGYHNEFLVKGPGIIVGRKGNVGSVYWTDFDFFPIDTVYFVKSKTNIWFLFFLLQSLNFINNDAAVPGLNRNQAYSNELLLAPSSLIKKFDEHTRDIINLKTKLNRETQLITSSRSLLLPRLISGKLSVEDMDIQFPKNMEDAVA